MQTHSRTCHVTKIREWLVVMLVLTIMLLIYLFQLTDSGLWYDEAVEYYYSKYLTGVVPIGRQFNNMYERICFTFQPPLYNALMYLWLYLFDSESSFRLAGVLTTFIGALGFYGTLRHLVPCHWSVAGLLLYLTTASVGYYALECAEYNLMLCMECWMLFFFVRSMSLSFATRIISIVGFYLFATLSVYSQYGSAFIVVSLFCVLCYTYYKEKEKKLLSWLLGMGMLTIIFAILPLWLFFLRFQMEHQASLSIEHSPIFVINFVYSFVVSLFYNISWIFALSSGGAYVRLAYYVIIPIVGLAIMFSFASLIGKGKKGNGFVGLITASVICWLLFFVACACSFYAYNSWDGRLGCNNIILGTRYVLFFCPLLLLTLLLGVHEFYRRFFENEYYKIFSFVSGFVVVVYSFIGCWNLFHLQPKNMIREVTQAWILDGGPQQETVVQEWASGSFLYYYQHSEVYNEANMKNILLTDFRLRSNDEDAIERYLRELKVFDKAAFYYISNTNSLGCNDHLEKVLRAFSRAGYSSKIIDKEKDAAVLFLQKVVP